MQRPKEETGGAGAEGRRWRGGGGETRGCRVTSALRMRPLCGFDCFPGGSDGKESTRSMETWVQSLDAEGALEKGMATHSSILAWKNSIDRGAWQTIQSMGSQRVRGN